MIFYKSLPADRLAFDLPVKPRLEGFEESSSPLLEIRLVTLETALPFSKIALPLWKTAPSCRAKIIPSRSQAGYPMHRREHH